MSGPFSPAATRARGALTQSVELAPGKDVFAEAVCPAGTYAVGGGFSQFDESKPEEDGTDPDVVVSFAGINSTAAPPKFVPRRFEVVFRNTGTSTTTVGAARATCMPAAHTKLAIAKR